MIRSGCKVFAVSPETKTLFAQFSKSFSIGMNGGIESEKNMDSDQKGLKNGEYFKQEQLSDLDESQLDVSAIQRLDQGTKDLPETSFEFGEMNEEPSLAELNQEPSADWNDSNIVQPSEILQPPSKVFSIRIPYPSKSAPHPRSHACSCVYLNKMLVCSGQYNMNNSVIVLDDIYEFCFEKRKWNHIQAQGLNKMKQRTKSSSIFRFSHNEVIVFGGITSDADGMPEILADVYRLSIRNRTWKKIFTQNDIPPVYEHTAVYHEAREWMIVFGGWNISDEKRDSRVYALDLIDSVWKILWDEEKERNLYRYQNSESKEIVSTISINCPDPRSNHTATIHFEDMYIFGGENDYNCMNDVWKFNLETSTWTCIETSGDKPHPRHSHAACKYGQKMYIHGGTDDLETWDGDLYELDLAEYHWRKIEIHGVSPSPRIGHNLFITDVYDKENKPTAIIFGGHDFENRKSFNDCYSILFNEYDGFIIKYQELCISDNLQKRKLIIQEEKLTRLERENLDLKLEIERMNEEMYSKILDMAS